ncbi:VOC family protein [Muricauda sp. 2012CJ35-5]|uniref:VOC family protein n=1 Tax=Flagellimonas spongiicola TaxID=2942208 RepID=A0ABT0PS69_9FLAO|nr:VOC family protein [Allomuricauda spongiicola]MCL6274238.1 VOC family protein [Allomuricauda spongiicola]
MKTIKSALFAFLLLGIGMACNPKEKPQPVNTETPKTTTMKSYISIFEIPATDIDRAIDFYQTILDIEIEKLEFPGMEMGLLPYEEQMVTGVIVKGEGNEPSATGITIYLDGGNDLQAALDKVTPKGGQILMPKTPHADESGFFALFLDSEGNKMGLNSPN